MSQASSSTARTRRSSAARVVLQPGPLAVVAAVPPPTTVELQAPIDDVNGLPLIMCSDCEDVGVFAATTTQSVRNMGKRYFKCPRKNYAKGKCGSYSFEEEYVVYLHDNGYLLPSSSTTAADTIAADSTTEFPELVGKIDTLEKMVKEMVVKKEGSTASCICLVCGCMNVTICLLLAFVLVVYVVLK